MPKRILLAEQSDTTRQVAESTLRQNGFEVIAVPSSDKAMEVIEFTRPDLIIVGSDLVTSGNKPLFERLSGEHRTSGLPILLIDNSSDSDSGFPPEAIIGTPVDPHDFIKKVTKYAGKTSGQTIAPTNPLQGGDLDDEFIDVALGMDQIEVTDSEVMDKTVVGKEPKRKRPAGDNIGFDDGVTEGSGGISDTGRVESIMIRDDSSDIIQNKKPPVDSTGSGLDILPDAFGLESPVELDSGNDSADHDYNWFVNEMANEVAGSNKDKSDKKFDGSDTGSLSFTDNSYEIDPITPPPSTPDKLDSKSEEPGVEKFIQEFKKEVEKIQTDGSNLPEQVSLAPESKEEMVWEEKLENMTIEQVGIFTRQFSKDLAEQVAVKIAAKIDAEKLLALIKAEIFRKTK